MKYYLIIPHNTMFSCYTYVTYRVKKGYEKKFKEDREEMDRHHYLEITQKQCNSLDRQ